MKRLYLIRHAKSSWDDPTLSDFERPLNKRGQRDALFMGQRLHTYHVSPDIMITSPAKRAWTTAQIIAENIEYSRQQILLKNTIYDASIKTLLHVIRQFPDSAGQVMLFGHNPGLTILTESLTDTVVDNIPTCGIFCIDFDTACWKEVHVGNGKKVFFDYPKKHRS